MSLISMQSGSATSALCLEYFSSPRPEFNPCPLLPPAFPSRASATLVLGTNPPEGLEPGEAQGVGGPRDSWVVLLCVSAHPGHAGCDKDLGETTAARQGSDTLFCATQVGCIRAPGDVE